MRFSFPSLYAVTLRIGLFLFLMVFSPVIANSIEETSPEYCQKLIDDALGESRNNNYTLALEKLLRAESIAAENNWDDKLWVSKYHIGIIYSNISNFGESLDYFQEAFAITQKNDKLREKGAILLEAMGVLYEREKKYEDALHYMERAYEIMKNPGHNAAARKNTANNIASIYNKLNRPEESLKILLEVEEASNIETIDFLWKAIYIEAIFKNGEILRAKDMATKLHKGLNDIYEDEVCQTCLNNLLSEIYAALSKTDSAIYYSKIALNSTNELSDRIDFYKNISNLYFKKGEFNTALLYKDSVIQATDSLSSRINRHLYEANKVKFKVSEYQRELMLKKKQQQTERKIFVIIIVLGLIALFSIYKALRNKVVKQKQAVVIANLELEKERKEHLLAEKELETTRLKQQQLKHQVAEKNRELTAKTLYLTNRNELIQGIVNSLESNPKAIENTGVVSQIKAMKDLLKTDKQHNDFMRHFESVNPGFVKTVKQKHPQLNANDIRFLCYVFMNLSLKEIGAVFNISYNACIIRKQRIMDKMNLDKKESIYDYVLKLSQ
ncbi:MAG: tetratricopeptide repeat protein [Moheibacter sp.]